MSPGRLGLLLLIVLHMGTAAAFFGGYLFTYLFVLPRARRAIEAVWAYEHFVATLNERLRYAFITAYVLLATSGTLLAWWLPKPGRDALLVGKATLLLASAGIFYYTSWRLWPQRTFAAEAELPSIQASFSRLGIAQIVLIALASILGVFLAHG